MQFALSPYTQGLMLAINHTPSFTDQSRQLFFSHSSFILSRPICKGRATAICS